jgi:predicted small secreted protein
MRRFKLTVLALVLCLLLAGCSASQGSGDIDTLLRAPQLSGRTSAVQRALNSYLGESATLKYPAEGDFLSPFLFGDWDGDGTQEAAVLYTSDRVGPNVWLAVLEPAADNTWKVSETAEGLSSEVESVSYANLRDGASQQILVGYGNNQSGQYLAVYLYSGGSLQTILKQAYSQMILADVTATGTTQDLILALPTDSENGGITLQLLTNIDGLFRSTQTLSVGAGTFTGCAALHAGKGGSGQPYLVVDGWCGGAGSYLSSIIILYDSETGYLTPYSPPGTADIIQATLRYDSTLLSTDINADGTIDIPCDVDDGGVLQAPMDKRLRFLLWKDFTTASGGVTTFGVYDSTYGFFLPLPESMHGNILLKENVAQNGWTIGNTEGTETYCELRLVGQSQAKSNAFERVANIGSQQLQARILTPYYGFSLQKILDGVVVMENYVPLG